VLLLSSCVVFGFFSGRFECQQPLYILLDHVSPILATALIIESYCRSPPLAINK
jgi:hypothetical protein